MWNCFMPQFTESSPNHYQKERCQGALMLVFMIIAEVQCQKTTEQLLSHKPVTWDETQGLRSQPKWPRAKTPFPSDDNGPVDWRGTKVCSTPWSFLIKSRLLKGEILLVCGSYSGWIHFNAIFAIGTVGPPS